MMLGDAFMVLLDIRFAFNAINNESKMFFRKMSIPIGDRTSIIRSHNDYSRKQINHIMPTVARCLSILEKDYGVQNPF